MAKEEYYSSVHKDYVREVFDTPLIAYMREKKGTPLSYFGLPGEDATDVLLWQKSLAVVCAVERKEHLLSRIEKTFGTRLPKMRLEVHHGDIDTVIINDRGRTRLIGNQPHRPQVSKYYDDEVPEWRWKFDVVNLDYFGAFLPLAERGAARKRADALKHLFEKSRQDAWQDWLLMITTNADFAGKADKQMMKEFLEGNKADSSAETASLLDFVLAESHGNFESALLIYSSAATLLALAASNAGADAYPRGMVVYSGAKDRNMIHMAFEFHPSSSSLSAPLSRESLLKCPILVLGESDSPQLQLHKIQLPGVDQTVVQSSLNFIEQFKS